MLHNYADVHWYSYFELEFPVVQSVLSIDWRTDNLTNNRRLLNCDNSPIQDYVHPDDQTQPTYY